MLTILISCSFFTTDKVRGVGDYRRPFINVLRLLLLLLLWLLAFHHCEAIVLLILEHQPSCAGWWPIDRTRRWPCAA